MALTGLDGMERHADRLQGRRAESVDGGAGHRVGKAGQQCRVAADVVTLLVVGQTAPHHHVFDGFRLDLRDLLEQRSDDEAGHVVGPDVDERSLVGPADRGAGGGHDDCFGHGCLLES